MATRKKTTTKKAVEDVAVKEAVETEAVEAVETVEAVEEEAAKPKTKAKKKPIVAKDIDIYQYITVYNGSHGRLVYRSIRTGEIFEWPEFGDEQQIELRELTAAKNNSRKFFSNNYFMFDEEDAWVLDYLGVSQYYKTALPIEDFDDIFNQTAANFKKQFEALSPGQKRSVGYRASQLVAEGTLDSLSIISAIEEALGIELIEH